MDRTLSIAFIRPSMFASSSKDAMYPLIFPIVKAITPIDVDISFYDERIEKLPDEISANIIALSVETFSAKRAYLLAKKFKKQGKTIIMGGFHITACPDEAAEYSDAIIIGEIENIWQDVINDLKNGELKKRYEAQTPVDLASIKTDFSVFKGKKYNPIGLVQFSRGCKFACEFCSVHAFFKNSIRTKPIEKIIEEIKNIKENFVFFIDDNLFSDENKAVELFNALIPLRKKWCCQISIDVAKNKNLLALMKKSGCVLVLIGFESLNIENLKQMGKAANIKNNNYKTVIKNIYDAGIMIYGTFVIGYDSDTKETAAQLCNFAIENKFAIANFNPLMPMPGTKLYERMLNENRLTYEKWWLNDNYSYGDAMLKPKNMTPEELMISCRDARYKFNNPVNIFKRYLNIANIKTSVLFWIANLVSRAEIYKKQGKKLGGE